MIPEYKKNLDDEIDWKIIDQLHTATINFSTTSLELKKLFFVLLGISVPTLTKLAGDKLDLSLFIAIYILIITFWFFDSFTYFYQEKLREKMDTVFNKIKKRNNALIIIQENITNEYTIENIRTSKYRIFRSIFNVSLRFYLVLFILNTFGLILFLNQIIK